MQESLHLAGVLGALAICVLGVIWAYFSRLPIVLKVKSRNASIINRGLGFRRTIPTLLNPDGSSDRATMRLQLLSINDKTHGLEVLLTLIFDKTFLLSLRRIEIGKGVSDEHPRVVVEDSRFSACLVLGDSKHDPEIVVCLTVAIADEFDRHVFCRWNVSELVSAVSDSGQVVVAQTIEVPTLYYTTSYPNDRYATSFWIDVKAPQGHFWKSESGGFVFQFQPRALVTCGPGVLHWDVRLGQHGESTVQVITLSRQLNEVFTTYVIHLIPLVLAVLIATVLRSKPDDPAGVVLRAASVFLSLLSLRSVVPSPSRSLGRTRVDILLLTAILSMVWIMIFDLLGSVSW